MQTCRVEQEREMKMKTMKRAGLPVLLFACVGGLIGYLLGVSDTSTNRAEAQEATTSASAAQDNMPIGRKAEPIVSGQYPASS